jgi:CRP/FNR family cyclic AMP-dependent transcriptional regulator
MTGSLSSGSQKKHASHAEAILAKIDGGKSESRYRRDDVIYAQGEPAAFVFYIRAGKLKMTVLSAEGKKAVVAILPPGNFCGEECLTEHKLHLATANALTECDLIKMPKAYIVRALHDDPEFSTLFTTYLVERGIRVQEDLVNQLLNSTEKRLARLLLVLANYGKEDRPEPIVPKINQETLAEMIGTTRTHVNSIMNKFRQLGFIQYNGEIKVHKSLLNMLLHEEPQIESKLNPKKKR